MPTTPAVKPSQKGAKLSRLAESIQFLGLQQKDADLCADALSP